MIPVTVTVPRVDELLTPSAFGAGAVLRLVRSSTIDGDYVAVASASLQSGHNDYTLWDPLGGPSDWYKSRVESEDGANPSEYSDPFQAGTLRAYAEVDDLEALLPPTKADRDRNQLADVLRRASDYITAEGHRDFGRYPSDRETTEVRTFSIGAPTRSVRIDPGLVAVALVEYANVTGGSYTALPSSAWRLAESRSGSGFFDRLVLTDLAPIDTFPAGQDTLRLTSVYGWSSVPGIIRNGTLALARMIFAAEASPNGAPRAAPILASALPLETEAAIRFAKGLSDPTGRSSRAVRSVRVSIAPRDVVL